MIGLQKGMGPRVQTTTWLQELASGHCLGSQCIPEVRPWAGCQDPGTASGIREVLNNILENDVQPLGLEGM